MDESIEALYESVCGLIQSVEEYNVKTEEMFNEFQALDERNDRLCSRIDEQNARLDKISETVVKNGRMLNDMTREMDDMDILFDDLS